MGHLMEDFLMIFFHKNRSDVGVFIPEFTFKTLPELKFLFKFIYDLKSVHTLNRLLALQQKLSRLAEHQIETQSLRG